VHLAASGAGVFDKDGSLAVQRTRFLQGAPEIPRQLRAKKTARKSKSKVKVRSKVGRCYEPARRAGQRSSRPGGAGLVAGVSPARRAPLMSGELRWRRRGGQRIRTGSAPITSRAGCSRRFSAGERAFSSRRVDPDEPSGPTPDPPGRQKIPPPTRSDLARAQTSEDQLVERGGDSIHLD
jgi:hypothetical protein